MYRSLQETLQRLPIDFPPTESGVEIRLLKHLFTPEEARIALHLSVLPESLGKIYKRVKKTGISIEELEKILDRMVKKGSIVGGKLHEGRGKGKLYSIIHLAIGMHEFQAGRITKEYVETFEQYMDEAFREAFHRTDMPQIRTIPISSSISPDRKISTYDSVKEIVERNSGPFSAMNCVCRDGKGLLGSPCKKIDLEKSCITFGSAAKYFIDLGVGKSLSKEELLNLFKKYEEIGLVLELENTKDPAFICACCTCCCDILRSVKMFPRPAEYYSPKYRALVDPESCKGCKMCEKRCQMEAISIIDKIATINLDRCIGCGVCIPTCPTDSIQLEETGKKNPLPKDTMALFRRILMKRRGLLGSLKLLPKLIFKRKI